MSNQFVHYYKGYALEITGVAVDVRKASTREYVCIKVPLETAIAYIDSQIVNTIYLVSHGAYDECVVDMAFLDESLAEETAVLGNKTSRYFGDHRVEAYELLYEVPKRIVIHNMSEIQGHWTYAIWEYELDDHLGGYVIEGAYALGGRNRKPLVVRGTDFDKVMDLYWEIMDGRTMSV